ncbi:NADPH-dependent assimilatory sulfite reductase hemoprotein subunit [Hymenobacter norwichensis]|uniref:NADPH-dependent assimilatory sulfite reductase hemoprotein subunit n=1 Tax=Hymenobacter norwichensis TaxID=223903 RepID=UPI0003B4F492|nr:NADPH-dependent assimilatory sulfite reductase hemoprotein subunit [Hymenobacter norwichensis]
MSDTPKLSEVELIKTASNYLRGTLADSLANPITGALNPDDTQLIKFHGSYQQADRDLDSERKRQRLEPLYSLMIRVRVPGGIATPTQWLRMDELAEKFGNNTLKLTTRQTFQLHGVLKRNLKKTIHGFNQVLMDSIAGCGDVNRNVMCNPNPYQSEVHEQVYAASKRISSHLTPRTSAYWELWLDGEQQHISAPAEGVEDDEPIYGRTYLPRKFKIALAIPPHNDTDVFSNDLGLIAIEEDGVLLGFNVAIGGGMGMTFGMPETYPRLADIIGFVPTDKVVDLCEKVVTIQRDWGNRENRKFSRLKYTLDRLGLDTFTTELNKRLGYDLEPARPYEFKSSGDAFGWTTGTDGSQHLTLFIEGGRVADRPGHALKTALREIAAFHTGDFRLTGNQNLIIANVGPEHHLSVQATLVKHGIEVAGSNLSGLRRGALACVALNTCSLAFAEAERYLPQLLTRLEESLKTYNLTQDDIVLRVTGCPNGCARPYLGEIGLVGRSVGRYNLYLGASFNGDRLNKLYKEMLDEDGLIETLNPIFADYVENRELGERFGDFTIRKGYVQAPTQGLDFHA